MTKFVYDDENIKRPSDLFCKNALHNTELSSSQQRCRGSQCVAFFTREGRWACSDTTVIIFRNAGDREPI